MKTICILGGGNGAHQMAVDLTLRGYDIILCEHPSFEKSFKSTLEGGVIESTGLLQDSAKIHKVTMDFKEALEDVSVVYLVVPAIAHEIFFDSMIPLLKDGQSAEIKVKSKSNISAETNRQIRTVLDRFKQAAPKVTTEIQPPIIESSEFYIEPSEFDLASERLAIGDELLIDNIVSGEAMLV